MMTPMTLSPDSFTEIVPFMKKKNPHIYPRTVLMSVVMTNKNKVLCKSELLKSVMLYSFLFKLRKWEGNWQKSNCFENSKTWVMS